MEIFKKYVNYNIPLIEYKPGNYSIKFYKHKVLENREHYINLVLVTYDTVLINGTYYNYGLFFEKYEIFVFDTDWLMVSKINFKNVENKSHVDNFRIIDNFMYLTSHKSFYKTDLFGNILMVYHSTDTNFNHIYHDESTNFFYVSSSNVELSVTKFSQDLKMVDRIVIGGPVDYEYYYKIQFFNDKMYFGTANGIIRVYKDFKIETKIQTKCRNDAVRSINFDFSGNMLISCDHVTIASLYDNKGMFIKDVIDLSHTTTRIEFLIDILFDYKNRLVIFSRYGFYRSLKSFF